MSVRAVAREVIYDVATLGANPWLRHHLEVSSEHNEPLRKLGLAALLLPDSTHIYKRCSQLATRSYQKAGHEVVGLGYHSVVLRDGLQRVKKIHHRTLGMTPEEQLEYAHNLSCQQQALLDQFPEISLAQEFSIDAFPLNTTRSCVTSSQQYISNATPIDMTQPHTDVLPFLSDARDYYQDSGIMPDIVGIANLLQTADGIVLVDTVPLLDTNPRDKNAIRDALSILALHTPTSAHNSEK